MRKADELARGCMAKAKDGEMTFVLLGRDPAAPTAIRAWCAERVRLGKNEPGDPQIVEAEECARVMEAERAAGTTQPIALQPDRQAEAERLRAAIAEHHAQRGDDRCWLDDLKLYAAAGIDADPADLALPARGDFLASCERYWCQRQRPEDRTRPPGKTIGQLERENAELRKLLHGAGCALRSYQFHNASPDLAAEFADKIDEVLKAQSKGE